MYNSYLREDALPLQKDIFAVNFGNDKQPINTLCGQNEKILILN
jgi:hypothetical protein